MNIKTYNIALSQQIKKALNFAFTKEMHPDDEEVYFCNDTDTVSYRTIAKSHLVIVRFTCIDLRIIWEYCKDHLVHRHYRHFKMGMKQISHQDTIEVILDDEGLTQLNKDFGQKQQSGIMTGRKKFDALFQFLSKKLASIKRHFFASPYEMMLMTINENQKTKGSKKLSNLSYNIKPNGHEKIWISFDKNQFTVYFGISFDDRSQQQLCKIFFSELVDAKKHVNNSPSVAVSQSQMPKPLIDSFPDQRNKRYSFANGIISITLFGSLVNKPESMATYLANFRTYVYYHIQASKCYLHSRILKRINHVHKQLTHFAIEQSIK